MAEQDDPRERWETEIAGYYWPADMGEPAKWFRAAISDALDSGIALAPKAADGSEKSMGMLLIAAAPTMYRELELAADTLRDFGNVLQVLGKDVMSTAANIAERHIREQLAAIWTAPATEARRRDPDHG